ncbi:MAG: transcriptional regulatory family protein [Rhizobacter sp.]|nr:transcriptional regulatory family protein [Rhizobacter sp.]
MRLLLVEDDSMIGAGLQQGLQREGYAVDWMSNGHSALAALQLAPYGLLLLDLGLPDQDGMDLLKGVRQRDPKLPLIIVTARDALSDRLAGLDGGADDYLVKPFAIEELIARIRAVSRRQDAPALTELHVGPLRMEPARHLLWLRGRPLRVSVKDFSLLEVLMRHPGVVLSREQIEEQLYGWDHEVGSNAVEVRIHHLRKKLGAEVLQNIRGLGYRIREEE